MISSVLLYCFSVMLQWQLKMSKQWLYFNPHNLAFFTHVLLNRGGGKNTPRLSQLADKIATKFQRLHPCFWVQLSNWTRADTERPNRKQKRWQFLNFKYAYVPSCQLIKTLVVIWVSLPENKSNSLAFAEHFVLSTSGLVAHHSHKFQWNAGPKKRRYSRWNSVDILSESADTHN